MPPILPTRSLHRRDTDIGALQERSRMRPNNQALNSGRANGLAAPEASWALGWASVPE